MSRQLTHDECRKFVEALKADGIEFPFDYDELLSKLKSGEIILEIKKVTNNLVE